MRKAKIIQKQRKVCGTITEMNQNRGAVGDIYYSITGSNFFYFKSSVLGILEVNNTEKEDKIVLSLKNLSNF